MMKRTSVKTADAWFDDARISSGRMALAELIARETGCDKGCDKGGADVAEEVDLYPTPWNVVNQDTIHPYILAANGKSVTNGNYPCLHRGKAYAEIVRRANANAEVGEWPREISTPWRLDESSDTVCIRSGYGSKLTEAVHKNCALADAFRYLVDHVNRLAGRDGCPNATDGV